MARFRKLGEQRTGKLLGKNKTAWEDIDKTSQQVAKATNQKRKNQKVKGGKKVGKTGTTRAVKTLSTGRPPRKDLTHTGKKG